MNSGGSLAPFRGLLSSRLPLIGRSFAFVRRVASRRPIVVGAAIAIVVAVVGSSIAVADISATSPSPTPFPGADATGTPAATSLAALLASPTASPSLAASPTPSGSAGPSPSPSGSAVPAGMVAATTDGVWLPAGEAALATRKPIAVMIDDQQGARPQSGLSMANIVYQAPAEGGIPRYMALFQTEAPPAIGPVRSARIYFVAWAEEWRAGYTHMWGAPNAMNRLAQDTGKYIYNIDGLRYGGKSGYMWRTSFREAPHNLYTSYAKLETLTTKLGGTAPVTTSPFNFEDALPGSARLMGGQIVVPYEHNVIVYNYDWTTNTYPRSATADSPEIDASTGQRIAPSNVILEYMTAGLANDTPAELHKHRLDIQYVGHGSAMVFNNGLATPAIWTKKNEHATTLVTYASGPNKGQPVPMVRGQIFIQIVPTYVPATWTVGNTPAPEIGTQGN